MIGVLDDTDAHFESSLAALGAHAGDDLRMPTSVYAEVLVRPTRLGRLHEARDAIALLGIAVDPLSADAAERAASLRVAHRGLRFADALVLGYADAERATKLLTTDSRLRRFDRRIAVIG